MIITRAVEWVIMPFNFRRVSMDHPGNDEVHHFYIITWNITGKKQEKREPLDAKEITYREFKDSKLEHETVYPKGRSGETFVKIRKLAAKYKKCS